MLVLSRRVDEKICFPDLGIEIHLAAIKKNSARIGVHAPRSIRIVRAEIEDHPSCLSDNAMFERHSDFREPESTLDIESVQDQIDTANLALYLAQNQVQAQRIEYAEESLAVAIEALKKLNDLFKQQPDWKQHLPVARHVSESRFGYAIGSKQAWLISEESDLQTEVAQLINEQLCMKATLRSLSISELAERLSNRLPDLLMIPVSETDQEPDLAFPQAARLQWSGYQKVADLSLATWTA